MDAISRIEFWFGYRPELYKKWSDIPEWPPWKMRAPPSVVSIVGGRTLILHRGRGHIYAKQDLYRSVNWLWLDGLVNLINHVGWLWSWQTRHVKFKPENYSFQCEAAYERAKKIDCEDFERSLEGLSDEEAAKRRRQRDASVVPRRKRIGRSIYFPITRES